MSRDKRDKRGGHQSSKFYISDTTHAAFARATRRRSRAAAKRDLRNTGDTPPRYPVDREYFD